MTAGVIGANIGAGLVVLFWGPMFGVLMRWALARSAYLLALAQHARTWFIVTLGG